MIKEEDINKATNYKYYSKGNWPIHADKLLKLGENEVYYSQHEETIYIDDLEVQATDCYKLLPKKSLKELTEYLQWDDYAIGIYYHTFNEAILSIKGEKSHDKRNTTK